MQKIKPVPPLSPPRVNLGHQIAGKDSSLQNFFLEIPGSAYLVSSSNKEETTTIYSESITTASTQKETEYAQVCVSFNCTRLFQFKEIISKEKGEQSLPVEGGGSLLPDETEGTREQPHIETTKGEVDVETVKEAGTPSTKKKGIIKTVDAKK